MATKKIASVRVSPQAAASMALHCLRHKHASVHGVLLGHCKSDTVVVVDAVPVSHGTPTMPLVETALGLIPHLKSSGNEGTTVDVVGIVGWYTAPALLEDCTAGPVALRMAAQLSTSSVESVLLVVQNEKLAQLLTQEAPANTNTTTYQSMVKAFGRDFGNQWLDPIVSLTVDQPDTVAKALSHAMRLENAATFVSDLEDHFDDPTVLWYPNSKLNALVGGGAGAV